MTFQLIPLASVKDFCVFLQVHREAWESNLTVSVLIFMLIQSSLAYSSYMQLLRQTWVSVFSI